MAAQADLSAASDAMDSMLEDLESLALAPEEQHEELTITTESIAEASALASRVKGAPPDLKLNEDDCFLVHAGMLTKKGASHVQCTWATLRGADQAASGWGSWGSNPT